MDRLASLTYAGAHSAATTPADTVRPALTGPFAQVCSSCPYPSERRFPGELPQPEVRRDGDGRDREVDVSESGLLVVDVAAADDETTFAFHADPASRWATTSVESTTRHAGQPGVRLTLPRHAPALGSPAVPAGLEGPEFFGQVSPGRTGTVLRRRRDRRRHNRACPFEGWWARAALDSDVVHDELPRTIGWLQIRCRAHR